MTNLLNETNEKLKSVDKTHDDVRWVGNGEYVISWDEFMKIAEKVEYDDGYGAQEVASDLLIVGNGWWLERSEYDGSECWDYKTIPMKAKEIKSFTKVTKDDSMWESLADMNVEEIQNYEEVNDGIALCSKCHKQAHLFGYKAKRQQRLF